MRASERRTRRSPFDRVFPRGIGVKIAAPIGAPTRVLILSGSVVPVTIIPTGMPCLPDEPPE